MRMSQNPLCREIISPIPSFGKTGVFFAQYVWQYKEVDIYLTLGKKFMQNGPFKQHPVSWACCLQVPKMLFVSSMWMCGRKGKCHPLNSKKQQCRVICFNECHHSWRQKHFQKCAWRHEELVMDFTLRENQVYLEWPFQLSSFMKLEMLSIVYVEA